MRLGWRRQLSDLVTFGVLTNTWALRANGSTAETAAWGHSAAGMLSEP